VSLSSGVRIRGSNTEDPRGGSSGRALPPGWRTTFHRTRWSAGGPRALQFDEMSSLRELPSVHAVLRGLGIEAPSPADTHAVRATLSRLRSAVRSGEPAPGHEGVIEMARSDLDRARQAPVRRVVNATGVILQTNLGRAPLPTAAIAAMADAARGYSNIEYDLAAGGRGSRHDHLRPLLQQVTGAADGLVVNNNAAAVLMVLQVFAAGREAIVSRSEAVEIGGGFRIPDVMRESGVRLVEVGTTNRTYADDYERAIGRDTAMLLRVHASNFRVVGFTATPALEELAAAARRHNVLLVDDIGSGCLVDTTAFGMAHEPTVQESLAAGVDLVLFSGDKLLGGPQAGIIVGRADLVATLRQHPLARALRVDKLTLAALAATLQSYAAGTATTDIPVWRMASASLEGIHRRARRWARAVPGAEVVRGTTMVGGGSLPGEGVPTWCVGVRTAGEPGSVADRLRCHEPPVIARVADGRLLLDPRTVDPGEDSVVIEALAACLGADGG